MSKAKILIVLLLIAVAAIAGYFLLSLPDNNPVDSSVHSATTETSSSPLAVVIENDPEARPQFGLSQADIVLETVAEGGITRMLAIFLGEQPQKVPRIGPVRSARPYFVNWAYGFNAAFAHSGGSKEAFVQIAALEGFKDINEFYAGNYFWRDTKKPAPHNLYTSTELLGKYVGSRKWPDLRPDPGWRLLEKAEGDRLATLPLTAAQITADFSYDLFVATYSYDASSRSYLRSLAGKPDIDALTGLQIAAKNVVILYTKSTILDKELLTVDLETLGTGKAIVFRDGQRVEARWRKTAPQAPLELIDADGSKVALEPGPVWFAVLDQHGAASWK